MFHKDTYGRILIPMVTPFSTDGEVDLAAARRLARALVDGKHADSLILTGTTGEFFTMSTKERVQVFQAIVEEVGNDIPLIAGTGAASTKEAIELSRNARELGIETLMVVAPYYTKPNQEEIYHHFRLIAEAVDANIMVYNIPIFTGVNVSVETVSRLSKIENIVAIKDEAEMNPKQITEFLLATDDEFIVYCGDDSMITEAFMQGGGRRVGGVVSGCSHIAAPLIRRMISDVIDGNTERAGAAQRTLFPVIRAFGQNGRTNPVALLKEAIKMKGMSAGLPRLPLLPGTDAEIENVRRAMNTAGLL